MGIRSAPGAWSRSPGRSRRDRPPLLFGGRRSAILMTRREHRPPPEATPKDPKPSLKRPPGAIRFPTDSSLCFPQSTNASGTMDGVVRVRCHGDEIKSESCSSAKWDSNVGFADWDSNAPATSRLGEKDRRARHVSEMGETTRRVERPRAGWCIGTSAAIVIPIPCVDNGHCHMTSECDNETTGCRTTSASGAPDHPTRRPFQFTRTPA